MADNLPDNLVINTKSVLVPDENRLRFATEQARHIRVDIAREEDKTYYEPGVLTPAVFNLLYITQDLRKEPQRVTMLDFIQVQDCISELKQKQKSGVVKPGDPVELRFWDGQVLKDFSAKHLVDEVYHPMLDAFLSSYSNAVGNARNDGESNQQYEARLQSLMNSDLSHYRYQRDLALGLPQTTTVPVEE